MPTPDRGFCRTLCPPNRTPRCRRPAGRVRGARIHRWAFLLACLAYLSVAGMVLFGLGFGAIDAVLNAHAARHFGARDINWMHASYGLGAAIGPLLVTILLAGGLGWRRTYGLMALVQAVLAGVFIVHRRGWRESPRVTVCPPGGHRPGPGDGTARRQRSAAAALTFAAVETGLESGAGIWGYLFLTAGRGLPPGTAGVAVAAHWAMMLAGRVVLGPGRRTLRRGPGPGRGGRRRTRGRRADDGTRPCRAGRGRPDDPRPGRRPGLPAAHPDDPAVGRPLGPAGW
jgi:hypothetical protein